MRVTVNHRRHVATVAAAAGMALSVLLLGLAAVGGAATPDPAGNHARPTAAVDEAGAVNPWAAGDAAALYELAELGRAHLNVCP